MLILEPTGTFCPGAGNPVATRWARTVVVKAVKAKTVFIVIKLSVRGTEGINQIDNCLMGQIKAEIRSSYMPYPALLTNKALFQSPFPVA